MGVLGLAPFLQKTFPDVIRLLPDRLKGLSGKTVVIDGTLITQRLYFAPVPHQHRHVLGWYRLVKELKECGVRAICVFDGKERSQAKAREAERRKDVQRMAIARGSIEVDRLRRLRKLTGLLDDYEQLEDGGRQRVTDLLQHLASSGTLLDATFSSDYGLLKGPEGARDSALKSTKGPPPLDVSDELRVQDLSTLNQLRPTISGSDCQPAVTTSVDHDEGDSPYLEHGGGLSERVNTITRETTTDQHVNSEDQLDTSSIVEGRRFDLDNLNEESPATAEQPLPLTLDEQFSSSLNLDQRDIVTVTAPSQSFADGLAEDLLSELALLYSDYRQSRSKVAALSSSAPSSSQTDVIMDPAEAHTEYAMSKHQVQLTLDEGTLWNELAFPTVSNAGESTIQDTVALLSQKSNLMSQSYHRRTHPPTTQTYAECKTILNAMGVPCLESTGSFEAEALASSLVINGHADYVASEDTDVLVYEAPMIRNITNRAGPLVIVSGKDVRTVLQLDRASYIDFALLLGTDFSQRIKNIGPQRALKFIREHGSIERVIEREKKYPPRESADTYLEQVELARLVFQTLPPVPDVELLQPKETDEQGVVEILQRFGLHKAAEYDWDYEAALSGNYFEDNPSA